MENELTQQEKYFCELYVLGEDGTVGNPAVCYEKAFGPSEKCTANGEARKIIQSDYAKDYIKELRDKSAYETEGIKQRLTEKLLHIIEETSTAEFRDRRGVKLSVAPLRSVSVNACKALMDIYPIKVAQESKININSGEGKGITFNVIVPQSKPTETTTKDE